ncbi:MAG TPA: hypothetical protein VKT33_10570 [Candidatus Angelobacter sp.]|nr:hypothetical protein [Candidatus Angelobacter sp.]
METFAYLWNNDLLTFLQFAHSKGTDEIELISYCVCSIVIHVAGFRPAAGNAAFVLLFIQQRACDAAGKYSLARACTE